MDYTKGENITGYVTGEVTANTINSLISVQQRFYNSQTTMDVHFRIEMLKRLRSVIHKYEKQITEALYTDLRKSAEESYLTEIAFVLQEIRFHLKHLKKWVKPKRVKTPYYLFPSSGRMIYEPMGLALIIAPWNYPFNLLMTPLVGAISAGCCTVLKPSPRTPAVASVMQEMINETFDKSYIGIVTGGRDVNEILLQQRFDLFFFTGSPRVGKIVMKAAAENLSRVILELGGKSPCIVGEEADIATAAKRIAWGKTINAGQTCIAPDYLLVHKDVKDKLVEGIISHLEKMYGQDIKKSPFYPRIVSSEEVERLRGLMERGRVVYGGESDPGERYVAPSIIEEVKPEDPVMQEEIFGPLLPVLTFGKLEEAVEIINSKEKPLALYFFGNKSNARKILNKTTSGGSCINDTIMHVANHHLPFGGVGNSGTARYHGYSSFLAFSNTRSVLSTPTVFDNKFKYPPFRHFRFLKKIF